MNTNIIINLPHGECINIRGFAYYKECLVLYTCREWLADPAAIPLDHIKIAVAKKSPCVHQSYQNKEGMVCLFFF